MNYFKGFRKFNEEGEAPDQYIGTIKKQTGVAKKLWMGMPVVISNVKIGNFLIRDPKVFYVTDYDDATVTIKNVLNPMTSGDDEDDEINLDTDDFDEKSFTIPKAEFFKLLEPSNHQGADYSTAAGTIPWRMG